MDGVTFNEEEKQLAQPFYRRLEITNLDDCNLPDLFPDETYDFIVCADVLEHLREPGKVLDSLGALLAPQGKLLISVPNAAYAGLIGELMSGEFRYREEGLLDATHLRFFTRTSLDRFLTEHGWQVDAVDAVRRDLPGSEFDPAFDKLPPAVSRYLLAAPEALTYQLITSAHLRRGESEHALQADAAEMPRISNSAVPEKAEATFTVQLYLGSASGFDEQRKLSTSAVIGKARQSVTFALPMDERPIERLRLDLADRPGFVYLHRMTLRDADGIEQWQWDYDTDGMQLIREAPHEQMMVSPASPLHASGLILLHGEDPWFELPIHAGAHAIKVTPLGGGTLTVELGWPMSADYLALAGPVEMHLREVDAAAERERLRAEATLGQTRETARLDMAALHKEYAHVLERERGEHRQAASQTERYHEELLSSEQTRWQEMLDRERTEWQEALSRERAEHEAAMSVQQLAANELAERLHTKVGEHDRLAQHLRWIENSTVFRMTRPLVNLKMRVDKLRQRTSAPAVPAAAGDDVEPIVAKPTYPKLPVRPISPTEHPVDVIVPVYRGLEDTRRCIESVLSNECATALRLVVINDASPEPEVTAWLREAALREPKRLLLLENAENLGFVGTVNRGMELSHSNDVVLLNSDAEVANDWLDRLRRAAYSDQRVASVTPFSNNATICSYPRFCEDNDLPPNQSTASLDALFASANRGQVIDIPTGIGFCMYVRRDALQDVGLFDTENFGKGYGEENDFCRRAAEKGWRNLHALDTFVRHFGGVSFGDTKSPREQAAMVTLRRMHPDYEPLVHRFVAEDPARSARLAVDIKRLRESALPVVLIVMHDREGGTLRHVHELAEALAQSALFLMLVPVAGGVRLKFVGNNETFVQNFALPEGFENLVTALLAYGVRHMHFHHLIGHGQQLRELPARLGVAYDFSAHDFYTMCPHISLTDSANRFCGENGSGNCRKCLPAQAGVEPAAQIDGWRIENGDFLANARHVLAPSRDAARRFVRFAPKADIRFAPHCDIYNRAIPEVAAPGPKAQTAVLKIVVIGALSAIKGADLLEAVSAEVVRRGLPLELHLLGFAYRTLRSGPGNALTVHGPYEDAFLPRLLAELQPDVAWFPAQWPETYSYTLSACLDAALPIVAPDLGAFPERLAARPWTWIRPWSDDAPTFARFFDEVRTNNFIPAQAPELPKPPASASIDASVESAIGPWSYQSDYLASLPPVPPRPEVSDADLLAYGSEPAASPRQQLERSIKLRMLGAMVRARSSPALSRVVQRIPAHWQTRMKTWLRA
jgi:GT2 family glycosyltransferase